jgi:hypothetical protein
MSAQNQPENLFRITDSDWLKFSRIAARAEHLLTVLPARASEYQSRGAYLAMADSDDIDAILDYEAVGDSCDLAAERFVELMCAVRREMPDVARQRKSLRGLEDFPWSLEERFDFASILADLAMIAREARILAEQSEASDRATKGTQDVEKPTGIDTPLTTPVRSEPTGLDNANRAGPQNEAEWESYINELETARETGNLAQVEVLEKLLTGDDAAEADGHEPADKPDHAGNSMQEQVDKTLPAPHTQPVVLRGRTEGPIINGAEKPKLTNPQFNVVKALLEAGDKGLTKDELVTKSGHTDALGIVRRLADKDPDWKLAIQFAGIPGGRYRIG